MKVAILGNMDIPAEEGVEFKRYDIHKFFPNIKTIGLFDRIYVSNALPELSRDDVMKFLEKVYSVLAVNGELTVQVPMAEFACKQIFMNKADLMTYYMLYGNDSQPFHACYTMMQIRTLISRAGFNVREASEAILKLTTTAGDVVDLPIHHVVAYKPKKPQGEHDDNTV